MSRRFSRGVGGRLVALMALVAFTCSIATYSSQAHPAAAPTLVVDNSFALDSLDPQRQYDPTSTIVDRAIYDTLFTYRKNDLAHPIPLLVSSWSSVGSKTFTFRLRRDVRFADGTPLTSADVVFSLRRLINLKGNPSFLLAGAKVSAKDAYTVGIETPVPEAQLPFILANASTGIVNSALVRAHGGTDAADASTADKAESWFNSSDSVGAGSGPYELQSYTPNSQVELRANAEYWGARKPGFGGVVIRNMAAPAQFLNIQRGSHQIAIDLSADQAQTFAREPGFRVSLQPGTSVFYLFANNDQRISSIASNPRFRQGVRYALDYDAMRTIAGKGAIQAPGLIASTFLGALPQNDAVETDIAKAKADFAASGVGTHDVTLEYPSDVTIDGVSFAVLAQKVQANLQAAGLTISLSGMPLATFQPRFRAGKVPFGLFVWIPDFPDPSNYLVFTPGQLFALRVGWPTGSDPVLEKLAAKARVATVPSARRVIYQQIQRALNARSPFIPLIQPAHAFVTTPDVTGAAFSGAYIVDLTQISAS